MWFGIGLFIPFVSVILAAIVPKKFCKYYPQWIIGHGVGLHIPAIIILSLYYRMFFTP